jgi:predicted MFS family arabinose efflux permease
LLQTLREDVVFMVRGLFHRVFRWRLAALLAVPFTLLSIEFFDELVSGIPVVLLPLVREGLHLSYQQVGLLLSAGPLSSALFEPALLLLSDRWSKRWLLRGGLFALATGFMLAAAAPNFLVLLLADVLSFPAGGVVLDMAQAALIERAGSGAERAMTRWTILGGLGDLASPLAVAGLLALGLGWRQSYGAAAAIWLLALLLIWPQRFAKSKQSSASQPSDAPAEAADQPPTGLLAGLREALGDPLLLRWAIAEKLCTMVDEIFLALCALYLRDVRHASAPLISLVLAVGMGGSLLGLVALDRLIGRVEGARLLPWLALLTLIGVVGFLFAPTLWLAAVSLLLFDISAAGWYPITKAAAYRRLPGRTGTVQAVIALGKPFEIVLPAMVGLIAAQFGVLAGLGFLGLAPLGILLIAPRQVKPALKHAQE